MNRKTMGTKRLVLRPLLNNDYRAFLEAYEMKANGVSKKLFLKVKKQHQDLADADDYYRFYVFDKKSGAIVGQIDFDIYVRGRLQFANFGYQIDSRYRRKGYGKEAAAMGLKIGFKELKLNRLEAAINLDNKVSIKLAKSIGMKKEGIKRRYWFENGKWTDHVIYVANPEDIGAKARIPVKEKK